MLKIDTHAHCHFKEIAAMHEVHAPRRVVDAALKQFYATKEAAAAEAKAETERCTAIVDECVSKGVPAMAASLIRDGATLDAAKAKIDELKASERQDAADRRSTIDPLKAKIAADRQQLRACRAPATS